jgi:hypothetical protein
LAAQIDEVIQLLRAEADHGSLDWLEDAEREFSPLIRWVDDHIEYQKLLEKDPTTAPISENVIGYAYVRKEDRS